MSVLICTFASPRSTPEKKQKWIAYLEALRDKHRSDPKAVILIETLLRDARRWQ